VIEDRGSSTENWTNIAEMLALCRRPAHLRKTIAVAAVVGTLLFLINQADVVISGHANGVVWLKVGLTYVVPFLVSNYGIAAATYRPPRGRR
jgi:hypothetical protein